MTCIGGPFRRRIARSGFSRRLSRPCPRRSDSLGRHSFPREFSRQPHHQTTASRLYYLVLRTATGIGITGQEQPIYLQNDIPPSHPTMAPPSSSSSQSRSQSTPSASLARINNIASHISPTMASTTSFPAETVPQAPEDPLFGLARAYKADNSPLKVDLVCRKQFVADNVLISSVFTSNPFCPCCPHPPQPFPSQP